jgi:dihydrofolate reductase
MRKLLLQMNMTIDGFVADTNGQLDWMLPETDENQKQDLNELTANIDTILLGRKMAMEAIPHWEKVAKGKQQDPEVEFANVFVKTLKIVYSKSLRSVEGKNVSIENGDLKASVNNLKAQAGKDIITYGGAGFAASLLERNLIDELNLFIHPVSLGKGLEIFKSKLRLELVTSVSYNNGIVLNKYKPNPNAG